MKIFAVFNHPSNGLQQHQKEVQSAHLQLGTSYELEQASVGPFFSTVALTGTQGCFNSVHFDFIDEARRPVDIYAMPCFRNY